MPDAARADVPARRARHDLRPTQVFADAAAPAAERAGRRQRAGGFRHLHRHSHRHDLRRAAGARRSTAPSRRGHAQPREHMRPLASWWSSPSAPMCCARFIPRAEATDPDLKVNFNPFTATWEVMRFAAQSRAILNSLLGISWFWLVGALILAQLAGLREGRTGRRQDRVHAAARGIFDRHRARLAGLRTARPATRWRSASCRWARSA